MEKHTIGGLKNILITATDFDDIQDYFFTLTETNIPAIQGKASKNKALKDIIYSTLSIMCLTHGMIPVTPDMTTEEVKAMKITLVNMSMTEVRPRNFWHGSGFVNGKFIFTFFYFADLDKGMVSIAQDNDHVLYGRVSIKGVPNSNPLGEFSEN